MDLLHWSKRGLLKPRRTLAIAKNLPDGIRRFDGNTFTTLRPVKSKDWKSETNDMWFSMLGKKGEHSPYRYDGENLSNLEFPKHFIHDEILEQGIKNEVIPIMETFVLIGTIVLRISTITARLCVMRSI